MRFYKLFLLTCLLMLGTSLWGITTPNAHGGGFLKYGDTYYWYGEFKGGRTSVAHTGVSCYSSKDLKSWRFEGIALPVDANPESKIATGCIIERPKVIYNPTTRQFVMWFHLELKGKGYAAARAGVAVSTSPTGPFRYLYSTRICAGKYPQNTDTMAMKSLRMQDYPKQWTREWQTAVEKGLFVERDMAGGQMSRDMTLYIDDDGKAYHIYSSEENMTLQIAELTPDYLHHTGRYWRMMPGGQNEAPTIFKHEGTYWMITSGCTGWKPNAARLFSAPKITGPWTFHGNPCRGEGAETTFGGQGTYILPIDGGKRFVFVADVWNPQSHHDGSYLFIPITFENGMPVLRNDLKQVWNQQLHLPNP